MENTQLSEQPKTIKGIINSPKMQEQFAKALPQHLSPERFARISITALTRNPKLEQCTQESLFKCLLDLSAMGLEPNGRDAHLIPYGKECTLVVDYKGLVSLVRRSGDVAKIHADVIHANDTFEHDLGEVKSHKFSLVEDRGEVVGAYAQVTLKDGSIQAVVMSKQDVEDIRKRSKSGNNGPWKTDWAEMAKKTAFRRLTKWLTLSPEIMDSVAKIDAHEHLFEKTSRNVTPVRQTPIDPMAGIAQMEEPKPEVQPEDSPNLDEESDKGMFAEGGEV